MAVVGFIALYYGYRAIRFVARDKTEVQRAHYWKWLGMYLLHSRSYDNRVGAVVRPLPTPVNRPPPVYLPTSTDHYDLKVLGKQ
jgi:hypothetical protein